MPSSPTSLDHSSSNTPSAPHPQEKRNKKRGRRNGTCGRSANWRQLYGSQRDYFEMENILNVEDKVEEPKEGMVFNTIDEVREYYRKYGNQMGFPVTNRTSKKGDDGDRIYAIFACSRAGKPISTSRNIRRRLPSSKTDCKAKLSVAICPDGKWQVTSFRHEHNHALGPGTFVKRNLELNDRSGIRCNKNLNISVVEADSYENVLHPEKEFKNYTDKITRLRLEQGDAGAIHNYFMKMRANNPDFFYVIDLDEEGCLRNVFWADARSRTSYEEFGDVITLDTAYLTNKYDMPFAPFVGVNHHGQLTLLGCALLSGEDTETFTWLFRCWLACMSDRAPKAIITDQDNDMLKAIEIVFPNTRHRWCLWHIMKKVPEKLTGYTQYESIKFALQNAVYDSLTHEEFEERWIRMIQNYNLQSNEWVLSLYDERHIWMPAFMKYTFWAGMSTTQQNLFFDGHVNSRTTIKQFVEQYENALRSKVEKENHEDFSSVNSPTPCITHYAMEKQFQEAYTNTKFREFQHELTGKIYCELSSTEKDVACSEYEISEDLRVGEVDKRATFKVSLTNDESDIHCTCCLFESRGIFCRHAIVVLIHNKILRVPEKFIIPRWRKDLKRRHRKVKISYDDWSVKPEACRLDDMCNSFREVADLSIDSEDKTKMVKDWINKLKKELIRDEATCGSSEPTITLNNGTTTGDDDVTVLPSSKRKHSKVDQTVRKNKEKKKKKKKSKRNAIDGNKMQESQVIEGEVVSSVQIDGSNNSLHKQYFPNANPAFWVVPQNGQPGGTFVPPPMLVYGHGYAMNNTMHTMLPHRPPALPRKPLSLSVRQEIRNKIRKIDPRTSEERAQTIPIWNGAYGMHAVPNSFGMFAINHMTQPNVTQPTVQNLEGDARLPTQPTVQSLEGDATQPTVQNSEGDVRPLTQPIVQNSEGDARPPTQPSAQNLEGDARPLTENQEGSKT